ncbi:uncharacterized protein LOC122823502, partial [Gambusia affinis]|uniref:uncharacterized protein LOC122823502 n=1 Tax=Gambusia affinis TaxID=33528 RepID=UPI001CDBB0EF
MTKDREKRKQDQQVEPDEGAKSSADQVGVAPSNPEKIEELADLVKSLIESQSVRDQQLAKEAARQDHRWKSMQHQFHQIQQQVYDLRQDSGGDQLQSGALRPQEDREDPGEGTSQLSSDAGPERDFSMHREPKLHPLLPDDDIEHFLTTFERMAQVCRWPREEWAIRLIPLLTGKARSAYVLMDFADSEDYDKVKAAILQKYEITAETYRRRFRSLDILPGETPQELYVRLKEMFFKWVKPEKATIKEIAETMILEQFLRMVNPELEVWLREHDPKTAEKAAQLADVFTAARRGTKHRSFGRDSNFAHKSKSFGDE